MRASQKTSQSTAARDKRNEKASLAVLAATISTSAFAAPQEGRLIGDGKVLPREFVKGKSPAQRRDEIAKWMFERGATYEHLCNAAEKRCVDIAAMPLADGGTLRIRINEYFDGTPTISTYCRMASTNDMESCYRFEGGTYYIAIWDAGTGKWESAWDQLDPQAARVSGIEM